ncbi:unnamed protein product [Lampetra fluviatilis]
MLLLLLLWPVSPVLCCLRCSPIFETVRTQLKVPIQGLSAEQMQQVDNVIMEIGSKEAPFLCFLNRIRGNPDLLRLLGCSMLVVILIFIIAIIVTSFKKEEDPQSVMLREVLSGKEFKPALQTHSKEKKKIRSGQKEPSSKHHSQIKSPKAGKTKQTPAHPTTP